MALSVLAAASMAGLPPFIGFLGKEAALEAALVVDRPRRQSRIRVRGVNASARKHVHVGREVFQRIPFFVQRAFIGHGA